MLSMRTSLWKPADLRFIDYTYHFELGCYLQIFLKFLGMANTIVGVVPEE
jgi:hypothetical protein